MTDPPHPALAEAFGALDRAGAAWCLVRGETELGKPEGDVDLLVAREHVARLDAALLPAGFGRVHAWGHGTHRFFVAYDAGDDLWLKLDVVTELAFGRFQALRTGAERECLNRRERAGSAWTLARDDAFWALLLHCLLDKRRVADRHAPRLAELAAAGRSGGALARALEPVLPPEWSVERVADDAAERRWADLLAVAPELERRWRRAQPSARARTAANTVLARLDPLNRVARARGRYVALFGPDGVGKSTLLEGLERDFVHPTRTVYLGLYSPVSPGAAGRFRLAARLAWLGRTAAAISVHRARGRLVVSDRHTYDALLGPEPAGRLARLRRRILARTAPRPDLAVVLDAPAEVVHARKAEHPLETLEEQRRRYLALAERIPRAVVVDAARDPAAVRREVTDLVWRRYLKIPRRRN